MKTSKRLKNIGICLLTIFMISASCKKKKEIPEVPEEPGNEEELITTFKVELTDSASGAKKTYVFSDPDGPGGQAPFYGPDKNTQSDSVIVLKGGSSYIVDIIILDESKNPVVNISDEVRNEGKDHMIFFNNGNGEKMSDNPLTYKITNNFLVRYLDLDAGSPQRPIGLKTWWRTFTSSSKTPVNITLRHQPDVKNGTFSPGETDISVSFKVMSN